MSRRSSIVGGGRTGCLAVSDGSAGVGPGSRRAAAGALVVLGPFGQYDPQQLQRGFKIYREVCSTCHSLKLLSFRNLADPGGPGFTEAQAAAIAATFQVTDGPNDQGQMFQRPGKISDYFPRRSPMRRPLPRR